MRGALIAIEGIDGSGGTTQTRLLTESIRADGKSVYVTKAPWVRSPYESAIRAILRRGVLEPHGDVCRGPTLYNLFLLDRQMHWADIEGELVKGNNVVTDRWHLSTMVYQGLLLTGSTQSNIFDIESDLLEMAPHADLTIVIDLPVEAAQERMLQKETDSFEDDKGFQHELAKCYREEVSNRDDCVLVSGMGCVEEIATRVREAVSQCASFL